MTQPCNDKNFAANLQGKIMFGMVNPLTIILLTFALCTLRENSGKQAAIQAVATRSMV
jgi:hypothetical protein